MIGSAGHIEIDSEYLASKEVEQKLTDPEFIWEGLGPDGIKYPNAVAYHGKLNWAETLKNRREFDKKIALRIGNYANEYMSATDDRKLVIEATVGHILINQLIKYAGGSND